jgi:hypothetical protein
MILNRKRNDNATKRSPLYINSQNPILRFSNIKISSTSILNKESNLRLISNRISSTIS